MPGNKNGMSQWIMQVIKPRTEQLMFLVHVRGGLKKPSHSSDVSAHRRRYKLLTRIKTREVEAIDHLSIWRVG